MPLLIPDRFQSYLLRTSYDKNNKWSGPVRFFCLSEGETTVLKDMTGKQMVIAAATLNKEKIKWGINANAIIPRSLRNKI